MWGAEVAVAEISNNQKVVGTIPNPSNHVELTLVKTLNPTPKLFRRCRGALVNIFRYKWAGGTSHDSPATTVSVCELMNADLWLRNAE